MCPDRCGDGIAIGRRINNTNRDAVMRVPTGACTGIESECEQHVYRQKLSPTLFPLFKLLFQAYKPPKQHLLLVV